MSPVAKRSRLIGSRLHADLTGHSALTALSRRLAGEPSVKPKGFPTPSRVLGIGFGNRARGPRRTGQPQNRTSRSGCDQLDEGDSLPTPSRRTAWLRILMALRVVRSVSIRSAGWLMNCLPPVGWLPIEELSAG